MYLFACHSIIYGYVKALERASVNVLYHQLGWCVFNLLSITAMHLRCTALAGLWDAAANVSLGRHESQPPSSHVLGYN
jgi:hypothetical protein